MFESIGWAEILVLGVAGLFILGPERLPDAAAWVGRTVRKVREYATGARDQLKSELGPEYDELRKPLQDLQQLRNLDPKQLVANHLFGDNDNGVKPNGHAPQPAIPERPAEPPKATPPQQSPFDPDAT
ncbi:sec-independent protein translocase protein TatB [Actinokineospora alba]|uniref:Sec-independent protein translocase protein TatB n=1 Tax=Actinokineospora alba TaxID=504798 RepID=A0A1H0RLF7_9PSEU|nr:Sec-independent protein translocase protein TatB [Actinokineospora alba]TDP67022.1 sec-independent protein translocase protein TatB [Actinokineospora alba]SDJ31481.1 sec-independent protein translocase protein TatB [Actinokineospora alba]SDP30312.1 sec-independent protein translocase protein TatB [Actinokineospora alba]